MSDKNNRFLVSIRGGVTITKCKGCQKNNIFQCEICPECVHKDYYDVIIMIIMSLLN